MHLEVPIRLSKWMVRANHLLSLTILSLSLFCLILPEEVEARRSGFSSSSSRSRSSSSSSSRSRSSSWSSSRSSTRSKGGSFGGGFRSSSSLGQKPSTSSASRSSRSTSRNSASSRSSAQRSKPMTQRVSSTRYGQRRSRYRSSYGDSWWNHGSTWKSTWRNNRSYRWHFRDRYYGYQGYQVGIWDLYFLSHASDLFWYHHWQEPALQSALYEDRVLQDAELTRLESRIHAMEAEQIARDPDYLPDGIAPYDAYSDEYLREIRAEEESGLGLILLLSIFGGALVGYLIFFRRY